MSKIIWKNTVYLFCFLLVVIPFATIVSAEDHSPKKTGQNLMDYSNQLVYFINHEKYEQAKEIINQMSRYYLDTNASYSISLEAHRAYADQLLTVKSELTKSQLDRQKLVEESAILHIASEVLIGNDLSNFSAQLDEFYKNSVELLNQMNGSDDNEVRIIINNLEKNFTTLSVALQIMYPQEYHNQISSIINYFKKANNNQLHEAKDAIEYLVSTLEKLNKHTKEVSSQLVYSNMTPKTYLLGVSAITAIAFMTVFYRRWRFAA